MADITLISGSTLGGAEYVAEHLAEKLEAAGFSTETVHFICYSRICQLPGSG